MPKLVKGYVLGVMGGKTNNPSLITHHKNGFTLIELLVVIFIIVVLATIGFINYSQAVKKGRDARRLADLKTMQAAMEQYHVDNHHYPTDFSNWGSDFHNCHGAAASCTTPTKTYLKSTPKDPLATGVYTYDARPDGCVTTACNSYCLSTTVEDPNLETKPSECSSATGNYAVTRP